MRKRYVIAVMAAMLAIAHTALAESPGREQEHDPDLLAGRAALEDGLYDLAQEKFEAYIKSAFFSSTKAKGSVYLAEALYDKGEYQQVFDGLTQNRSWADGTRDEAGFTYWIARSQSALGRCDDTLVTLKDFDHKYQGDTLLVSALRLSAFCFARTKQPARAMDIYSHIKKDFTTSPELPDVLVEWAGLLLEQGQEDDAEDRFKEAIAKYPQSEAAHMARLQLAQMLIKGEKHSAAREVLQNVVGQAGSTRDQRASAWMALAQIEEARTNLNGAVEALTKVESLAGNVSMKIQGRIERAKLMVRMDNVEGALSLLQDTVKTMSSEPEAGEAQLELADLLFEQAEYEKALSAYQTYLEVFSDPAGQARALKGKGWSLWELKRYAEAASTFEKAYDALADPAAREYALVKVADSYFANDQFKLAEQTYNRVLTEFRDSARQPQLLSQVAECRARAGDVKAAEQGLRSILARYPQDQLAQSALLRIAKLREENGSWEDAIEVYDEFLQVYPDSSMVPDALRGRAMVSYRLGLFKEAQKDFNEVVEDFPKTPAAEQSFYMRAWCSYLTGDSRRAVQTCQQFLTTYTNSVWVPDVMFWLGEHYFNSGSYRDAETILNNLSKKFPDSALSDEALFWAGRSAAEQNEYRRAISCFNDLAKTYTNSAKVADARFAQGDALSELGEFSGAILAFDEIIRNYQGSYLADRARGRKGDCQFTLGADRPERYQEALASYDALLNSPTASVELKMQAEYKIGRCYEKMNRRTEAFEHYMNVVYDWLAEREAGRSHDAIWFTRAAFSAAAMKEADQQQDEALKIYQRVVDAAISASPDAEKQMQKIRSDTGAVSRQSG